VFYQSQTKSLSLEMNQYFVVIAYSNNVYFFAILGDPLGGHPKKIFQALAAPLNALIWSAISLNIQ